MKHIVNLLVMVMLASCGYHVENYTPPCDPAPVAYTIIWKMSITPQEASLTIKPGDTVRWVWGENDMPHNVISEDPDAPEDFGSEIMIGEGSVYEYVFLEEVVFDYFCSVHPTTMTGSITVQECVDE